MTDVNKIPGAFEAGLLGARKVEPNKKSNEPVNKIDIGDVLNGTKKVGEELMKPILEAFAPLVEVGQDIYDEVLNNPKIMEGLAKAAAAGKLDEEMSKIAEDINNKNINQPHQKPDVTAKEANSESDKSKNINPPTTKVEHDDKIKEKFDKLELPPRQESQLDRGPYRPGEDNGKMKKLPYRPEEDKGGIQYL